jgi:hypothetical protein
MSILQSGPNLSYWIILSRIRFRFLSVRNGLGRDQWRSPRSPAARRGHAHSGPGLQREINLNESARFTTEREAALFERKVALSFAQGSGAIEWFWNTNSYMTEANEAPIGALRADSTEKPEAPLMRDFAGFAKSFQNHLQNPKQPSVAIVTSQAAQFSVLGAAQLEAQHKAVRALAYGLHISAYVIAENLPGKVVPLSFDQQKQFALEALRFSDGSTWKEIAASKGKVFWSSYSAGLAEGLDPAVALSGYVLEALRIKAHFDLQSPLPPSVLIYSTESQDSVLYILESENVEYTPVDLRDVLTGARLTRKLPAQDALALIVEQEKSVIAKISLLNLKGIESLWLRLAPPSWAEIGEADAFILACNFSALCDSHQ